MASITIRRLDESLKTRLRIRAARHGRSMEEEARQVLSAALTEEPKRSLNLAEAIRRRIEPLGGVELEIPARDPIRRPPKFS
jgi:plasmid stability protein